MLLLLQATEIDARTATTDRTWDCVFFKMYSCLAEAQKRIVPRRLQRLLLRAIFVKIQRTKGRRGRKLAAVGNAGLVGAETGRVAGELVANQEPALSRIRAAVGGRAVIHVDQQPIGWAGTSHTAGIVKLEGVIVAGRTVF